MHPRFRERRDAAAASSISGDDPNGHLGYSPDEKAGRMLYADATEKFFPENEIPTTESLFDPFWNMRAGNPAMK
jgi:hypothetical protein